MMVRLRRVHSSDESVISVAKNQITFSQGLLKKYNLKEGDKVEIEIDPARCLMGIVLDKKVRPLYTIKSSGITVLQTPKFVVDGMKMGQYVDVDAGVDGLVMLRHSDIAGLMTPELAALYG